MAPPTRYSEGDCIPPHIDHHDFVRPFVTLSLLSEQPILFGKEIKIVEDGIFDAPVRVALPVGSVLVLNGNGADVAKHCVPAVSGERVSITFRKMRGVTLGSKKKTVEYKGAGLRAARRRLRARLGESRHHVHEKRLYCHQKC